MPEPAVWVFFYGSYINMDVLREAQYSPARYEVARLAGFDICIRPRANLVRSTQHCVYGILATGTHAELSRLYAHAKDVLGETFCLRRFLLKRSKGVGNPLFATSVRRWFQGLRQTTTSTAS